MKKNEAKRFFTGALASLLQNGLSLKDALDCMQSIHFLSGGFLDKGVGVQKKAALISDCAKELNTYLAEGSLFSVAIKKCSVLRFDSVSVAFIASAEKGGSLEKTFRFLSEREEKRSLQKKKVLSACVYPLFVSGIAFIGSFLLRALFSSSLLTALSGSEESALYSHNSFWGLICANFFLLCSVILLFFVLRHFLKANVEADIFRIIEFLVGQGKSLVSALEVSILLVPRNVKMQQKILESIEALEAGFSAKEALGRQFPAVHLYMALAEQNGSLSAAFLHISNYFKSKAEAQEKTVLSLLEPFVMVILALYIIILLKTVIAPLLFATGL